MKEYKSLNARCWVGGKKSDLGELWQWAVSRGQESQHPVSLGVLTPGGPSSTRVVSPWRHAMQ